MSLSRKVIITCAVTGAIHTPSMSPHLPITPQDRVREESFAYTEDFRNAAAAFLAKRKPVFQGR